MTPDQAQAYNEWIAHHVALVLNNDRAAHETIRERLATRYQETGIWDFQPAFDTWLEDDGYDLNGPAIMLLRSVLDLTDPGMNSELVDRFVEEHERVTMENGGDLEA